MLNKSKQFLLQNGTFYVLAMLIAIGLKYHYSRASSDELDWILRPTARVVEMMSGLQYEKEVGAGYISTEQYIIIAPSCAGVNFLIINICMAVFSSTHLFSRPGFKLLCLGGSIVSAYLLTVVVNALRIIAAIPLYQSDIYFGWLTQERLHRIEGIMVYFFFLCGYYVILQKLVSYGRKKPRREIIHIVPLPWWEGSGQEDKHKRLVKFVYAGLIPFFWYIAITLGVPLIRRSYQVNIPRFIEHSGFVLAGCVVVVMLVVLLQVCWERVASKK